MDKKIYKDPFILVLLGIIVMVDVYSKTAASQSATRLTNYFQYISALSFISLIIYMVLRPYLRRKHVKPVFGVSVSLLIGLFILIVLVFLAFGLAMSGG